MTMPGLTGAQHRERWPWLVSSWAAMLMHDDQTKLTAAGRRTRAMEMCWRGEQLGVERSMRAPPNHARSVVSANWRSDNRPGSSRLKNNHCSAQFSIVSGMENIKSTWNRYCLLRFAAAFNSLLWLHPTGSGSWVLFIVDDNHWHENAEIEYYKIRRKTTKQKRGLLWVHSLPLISRWFN